MNLTKEAKTYTMIAKNKTKTKIQKTQQHWKKLKNHIKDIPCSWIRRFHVKMVTFSKLTYILNVTALKIQLGFVVVVVEI